MKKILYFMFAIFFIACSSVEPVEIEDTNLQGNFNEALLKAFDKPDSPNYSVDLLENGERRLHFYSDAVVEIFLLQDGSNKISVDEKGFNKRQLFFVLEIKNGVVSLADGNVAKHAKIGKEASEMFQQGWALLIAP